MHYGTQQQDSGSKNAIQNLHSETDLIINVENFRALGLLNAFSLKKEKKNLNFHSLSLFPLSSYLITLCEQTKREIILKYFSTFNPPIR